MRLVSTKQRRPMVVADKWRDGRPIELTPRDQAINWLAEKIAAGEAGLDPFDPSVFIVVTSRNEYVWARHALPTVAFVDATYPEPDGGRRWRITFTGDARTRLQADSHPVMADEPLASQRAQMSAPTAVMDAVFKQLPDTPPLHLVPVDPETHARPVLTVIHSARKQVQP